jgi:hypothetical protein
MPQTSQSTTSRLALSAAPRPNHLDQPIAPGVVEAFHLDQEIPEWPTDANGNPLEMDVLTFEEQQEFYEIQDRRLYGDELLPGDSITTPTHLNKPHNHQQHTDFTGEPPF